MRLYKNIELDKNDADKLSVFLKENKIKYEASGVGKLIHFEILVNTQEENKINKFLDTLD